jgi:hypothetical protein
LDGAHSDGLTGLGGLCHGGGELVAGLALERSFDAADDLPVVSIWSMRSV